MSIVNKNLRATLKATSPEGLKTAATACGESAKRLRVIADMLIQAQGEFNKEAMEAGCKILREAKLLMLKK